MCLPLLAGAGAAAGGFSGIGTALSVVGGVLSAAAQYQQFSMQQKAAEETAKANDRAARETLKQAEEESDRRRRQGAALAARNTAGMAANGIDLSSQTALDVLDDSRTIIEDDAFAIRETGRSRAHGFAQAAANARAEAKSAGSSALFAPIQTLIGTAAKVGSRWSSYSASSAYSY